MSVELPRCETIAADLAAETFAVAFRGWLRLPGRTDGEVRARLFTVARRQVSRYLRRARAEQRALRRLGIQSSSALNEQAPLNPAGDGRRGPVS